MSAKPACLTPECDRAAHARGLCRVCYAVALREVKAGRTTWQRLEAAGFCRPSYARRTDTSPWREWAASQIQP